MCVVITSGTSLVVIVINMTSLSMMSSLQEERYRLREAANNGDVDGIKRMLSSGVDVNAIVGNWVS